MCRKKIYSSTWKCKYRNKEMKENWFSNKIHILCVLHFPLEKSHFKNDFYNCLWLYD